MARRERREGWPESLADYLGWVDCGESGGVHRTKFEIRPEHVAPNGFLQAGVVVSAADLCCARGTFATIPENASFTTVELKINLVGTATEGTVLCEATCEHSGRTTQVWDAKVVSEKSGRTIALFRCTQLILYPGS